ncbi:hypothetical protein FQN51_001716 [Onygenales sp. PD_10]|nr:hypothetical protein FQN51_001716 [Onygenales sp. PD_10]
MERDDLEAPFYDLGVLQKGIKIGSYPVEGWYRLRYPTHFTEILEIYTHLIWMQDISRDDENGIPTTFMLRIELDKIRKPEHLLPQSLLENARDLCPTWKFPAEDIYLFHGILIVLCKRLETEEDRAEAIKKAEGFLLDHNSKAIGDRSQHITRAILISLRHIVVAEFSTGKDEGTSISCSKPIPLLTDKSAI